MGRKNTASKNTGARYIPANPLAEDQATGLSGTAKLIMKIIGILMVLMLTAFLSLAYGGQGTYLYVYWAWVGPLMATLFGIGLLVIIMLALRGITKTRWSRLGVTCAMVLAIFAFLSVGIAFIYVGYTQAEMPIAYLNSPAGERIVIMRSVNMDKDPEARGGYTFQYTGYQMLNKFFYLALPSLTSEPVYSDVELNPKWEVDWMENDDARLYLPDHEGEPFSETFITVYDLDNLQASLDEKGSGVYHSETQDMEPLEITPAPSVDPFAY